MDSVKNFIAWVLSLFAKAQAEPVISPLIDFFPFAVAYVLQNEGGFSDRDDDNGGPTNFGITQSDLAEFRGHPVTASDVKSMSVDDAKTIYRTRYWLDVGLDKIKSRVIVTCLLDQAVLNGPHTGVMYAQLACNNCGAQLVVDGVVGPLTLAALEKVDVVDFLASYHGLLKSHFDAIVARNQAQLTNYGGWMKRADRLLTLPSVS